MLLSYCRVYPQDEDTLRVLLELLSKQGRYQDVLEWYKCLETALDEAGLTKTGQVRTPHPLTAEIAAYARLKRREEHLAENRGGDDLSRLTPATPSAQVVISSTVHSQPLPASPTVVLPEARVQSDATIARVPEVVSRDGEIPHTGVSVFDRFDAFTGPLHSATSHLIGRETWLVYITQMVQASLPKKLIILHGPIGIGKSSELNRLAEQIRHLDQGRAALFSKGGFAS